VDRGHDARTGPRAADEHITVVGIAHEPMAPPCQLPIQLVEDDIGQKRRQRAALRGAFPDDDPRAVRHHDRRLQHQAHQSDHPAVRHPLTDTVEQALVMDSIEELGQIEIHDRPVAGFEVLLCLGDGRHRTAPRPEPVTAGVEGRLEHRLQHLEHGLLHDPVDHVGDAEAPLPASGLRDEHPTDITGPVAPLQQRTTQPREKRRRLRLRLLDRLSVETRCALVAHHVDERQSQIGLRRHLFQQPTGIGCPGDGSCRSLALRSLQQERAPLGCVRRPTAPAPIRAVGEHEAQLTVTRPSQPISPFAPRALPPFIAPTRRSDFWAGIGWSSLPPSGLPLDTDPPRPPRVRTLDVPPPPLPLPSQPRLDFGRRVRRHAHPAGMACPGVHSRSVLRFASGFFPTRPRGASIARLTTDHAACSCLRLTVATNSPRKGLPPPIQCPCRAHLRSASTRATPTPPSR
jgi:hypothetical protein